MSFVVGETVGPYRVMEQLGSGGMATVFKAYHASLDRYVAIKVLHPAFKADPSFLARFQREARVVARLEHPNIVPVYDFNEHNGQPYLVMRYVEGDTLKARLSRGPLAMEQTLRIVHSVGAALMYAHGQGVLHRDIKPSNVMLTSKGDVFLTDFGLARIAQAGESTLSQDAILGTPQYISPEQAKGERDLDARTDVYSLGVVVYELLVGRVPYQADTPYAVVHDHIFTPLPMPRAINPELPEPLERFLLKTLSKNRDDRFASIDEMMGGLNRAVDESGIELAGLPSTVITSGSAPTVASKPKPAAETTVAPAKKPVSPLVWIGVGAATVIIILILLFAARQRQTPASPATPAAPAATQPPPGGNLGAPDKPPLQDGEANRALDEALELFRRGSDLVLQERPEEARGAFLQAAETAERGLGALPGPGVPVETELQVLATEAWLAAGNAERAQPHAQWLVKSIADKARALSGLALTFLLQQRTDEALRASEEAVAASADLPEAHAVRGCALMQKGEPLAAAREFREAAANASGVRTIPPWLSLVLDQLDCRLQR